MAQKPHLLLMPLAAQGHISPMMKLACNLVHHGIKVKFVTTVSTHSKLVSALSRELEENSLLTLVSVPEMLKSDTADRLQEAEKASRFLESQLQNFILKTNELNQDEKITHFVADVSVTWAFELANRMGIKAVGFVPFGMANFSFVLRIPELIETGIMDTNGMIKEGTISLSNDIPAWNPENLVWRCPYDEQLQIYWFKLYSSKIPQAIKLCNTILVNSFQQLETSACNSTPNILPIGPLSSMDALEGLAGNLRAEDLSCLTWFDQQSPGSVIYAAFGSTVVCSQQQLKELAFGFEAINRPFLWVVRSDFTEGIAATALLPEGFAERVASYGKIVEWAPQEKVLSHPSVGCFFSHCGWNSTIEGISKGVPFLCWPYLADQFRNRDYICETWKIGLEVVKDENGIVTRDEMKSKIEKLVNDEDIKANSLKFKELCAESIRKEGSSFKNFECFIDQIKQ